MRHVRVPRSIGYVAVGLIVAHALLSAYWAAGGTALLGLLSEGIQEQADLRESWFISLVWGVALLKFGVGVVGLALIRNWPLPLPRWFWLVISWGAGIVLTSYGLMNMLSAIAVLLGLVDGPGERGTEFWAYFLFWSPWWLLIGVTFSLLSWGATSRWQRTAGPDEMTSQKAR